MTDRNSDLSELLAVTARMAELAARHELTVATHLLDLLQLELIKSLYGYSDGERTLNSVESESIARRAVRKTRRPRLT